MGLEWPSGANVVIFRSSGKEARHQVSRPVSRKHPTPRIFPLTLGTKELQTASANFYFLQP